MPDPNDLASAFRDLGTFAPLTISMITVLELNAASVLVVFGICYLLSALVYRMPMPVQPMKAIAALAIAGGATMGTMAGSGLTIGLIMFILAATGSLEWLAKITPRCAVRGIQLGLAFTLIMTAIRFMEKNRNIAILGMNVSYLAVAAICFVIVLVLSDNRSIPSLLIVVPMGIGLAAAGGLYSNWFRLNLDCLRYTGRLHMVRS
jgi:hypothetical protein